MFIQTEPTPNPATLKFLPGREVAGVRPAEFRSAEAAQRSPLAAALLAIDGVSLVFLGDDFVSVTKDAGEWQHLKPAILGAIMEHFVSGAPVFLDAAGHGAEELRDYCNRHLGRYKVPTEFWFVPELPKNASGKILKRELVNWAPGEVSAVGGEV